MHPYRLKRFCDKITGRVIKDYSWSFFRQWTYKRKHDQGKKIRNIEIKVEYEVIKFTEIWSSKSSTRKHEKTRLIYGRVQTNWGLRQIFRDKTSERWNYIIHGDNFSYHDHASGNFDDKREIHVTQYNQTIFYPLG